jgi:multidrug efflux system membrane fusion protein
VRRGQELAVLDPQPMRLQRIQAEAELRRAEQVASERTAAAARAKSLFDAGVTTRAELEGLQAESVAAREALVAVRAGLALAQRAEREITLRAPADGVIAARHAALSQMIAPGTMVFELDGPGRRDIKVAAPARGLIGLQRGEIIAYQYNGETGQARFLGASARALAGGAQEARFEIVSGDPAIGAPVDVLLTESQVASASIVPISAVLTRRDGSRRVLVVGKDSKVREVPVDLVRLTSEGAVVSGTLALGERVVAAGGEFVRVGATVRPVSAQR